MVKLKRLTKYLDEYLALDKIPGDGSNNGLQVEGNAEVRKAVFGVDACLAIADIAARKKADFIFVHHGLSWREGFKRLTGHSAKVFSTLFKNEISLYGAHLPLDAHPVVGHNAQIAKMLGLQKKTSFAEYANVDIGFKGTLKSKLKVAKLANLVDHKLGTKSKIFGDRNCEVRKIGVISGGAGLEGVAEAVEDGLDCLITGEVNHCMWHPIQEAGIQVIAGGHYATEKPGVLAMMKKIHQKFGINCEFIELPTGL